MEFADIELSLTNLFHLQDKSASSSFSSSSSSSSPYYPHDTTSFLG